MPAGSACTGGAPGNPPVPWIAGNPIHLLAPMPNRSAPSRSFEIVRHLDDVPWAGGEGTDARRRTIPKDGTRIRSGLPAEGSGARASQYVAVAAPLTAAAPPVRTHPLHRRPRALPCASRRSSGSAGKIAGSTRSTSSPTPAASVVRRDRLRSAERAPAAARRTSGNATLGSVRHRPDERHARAPPAKSKSPTSPSAAPSTRP